MNTSWITLLTFTSVTLLTISLLGLLYDRFFRYQIEVRERLNELGGEKGDRRSLSLFGDGDLSRHGAASQRLSLSEWLREQATQAELNYSIHVVVAYVSVVALLAMSSALMWRGWVGGLVIVLGLAIPVFVIRVRQRLHHRRFTRQLPDAFSMIGRAVRAGQTVPSALRIIAQDFEAPISTEFARCYEQQELGMGREAALRQLAKRTGVMELQIFVVALLVQGKSGGDLVELLDNLATMVRKRLRLKDQVQALTGEARMQAIVLMVLPVAALLGMLFVAPEYVSYLLDRPGLLAGTAAAQAVGVVWIRKIVNFEY